jgi:hypothetical protein
LYLAASCFVGDVGPFQVRKPAQKGSRGQVGAVYFHPKEPVKDWRVTEMVQSAELYFTDIWTKGKLSMVSELLHESFVHKDIVWSADLVVGQPAFIEFVNATRKAYPDFWVEISEIGTCNTHQLFVSWEGAATWLGVLDGHQPSHHNTRMSGISLMTFDEANHKKITEVSVYRTALSGDKQAQSHPSDNWHELRLSNLLPAQP